jgi:hypothetical protein
MPRSDPDRPTLQDHSAERGNLDGSMTWLLRVKRGADPTTVATSTAKPKGDIQNTVVRFRSTNSRSKPWNDTERSEPGRPFACESNRADAHPSQGRPFQQGE